MALRKYVLFSFIFISIIYIVFSFYGYPLLTNDTQCFLPVSYELRNGTGLYNHLYNAGIATDNKFIFYPPFFPFIISLLLFNSEAISIYMSLTFINLLSLFFLTKMMINYFNKHVNLFRASKTILFIFSFLFFLSNASFSPPGYSRPEVILKLFIYIILWLFFSDLKHTFIFYGIIIALAFLSSPLGGFIIFLLLMTVLIYQNKINSKNITLMILPFSLVMSLFVYFYPFSIIDLFDGIKQHSINVSFTRIDVFTLKDFFLYHLFNNNGSFGFLLFLTSLFISYKYFYFKKLKNINISFSFFFFILLLATLLYFGFRNLAMSYYFYLLSPVMLFLIYFSFFKYISFFFKILYISFLFLFSLSLIRTMINFGINFSTTKFNMTQTDKKLQIFKNSNLNHIGISPSLWPFFYDKNALSSVEIFNKNNYRYKNFDYIILQQYTTGLFMPEHLDGYIIVEDNYLKKESNIFNLKFGSYSPFYQYAVYKRN